MSSGVVKVALAMLVAAVLSACSVSSPFGDGDGDPSGLPTPVISSAPPLPVVVTADVADGAGSVAVDKVVKVSVTGGRLETVAVTSKKGRVPGRLDTAAASWTASKLLEPGTRYTIVAQAVGGDGTPKTTTTHFRTRALTLDQQTYPSISPLAGQTVGVGMPVIVTFDKPVTNRASIERHLAVTSVPAQVGSWYWISDTEVHWRPRTYWKAHSVVTVHADINSVPAGRGIFGQVSRKITFKIGAKHVYKVNMKTDQMRVMDDGKLVRTIPVTTGKPGFTTRSGIKVITQKYATKEMNSETIGIGKQNSEYYDLKDVQWAMRMTFSGEFLHAAPWSVADQGRDNVSHGCTGMSTANADWLYHHTIVGDVVDETGTDRPMELTNGWGDWNLSWAAYQKGSALYGAGA